MKEASVLEGLNSLLKILVLKTEGCFITTCGSRNCNKDISDFKILNEFESYLRLPKHPSSEFYAVRYIYFDLSTFVRQFFDCVRPTAASPICSLALSHFMFKIVSVIWILAVIT